MAVEITIIIVLLHMLKFDSIQPEIKMADVLPETHAARIADLE